MKKFFPILIVLLILGSWLPVARAVETPGVDELSFYVWQRINEIRVSPLTALEEIGIQEDQARAALGGQAWILDRGLPPFAFAWRLWASAQVHADDMLANQYYDFISPAGLRPQDRMAATGYPFEFGGEALGALVFENYLAPEQAARLLVENMLRDELAAGEAGIRNILSAEMTECGVGFLAVRVDFLGDQPCNVYLAVVDVARPRERVPDLGLLSVEVPAGSETLEIFEPGFDSHVMYDLRFGSGAVVTAMPGSIYSLTALGSDGGILASRIFLPQAGPQTESLQ